MAMSCGVLVCGQSQSQVLYTYWQIPADKNTLLKWEHTILASQRVEVS